MYSSDVDEKESQREEWKAAIGWEGRLGALWDAGTESVRRSKVEISDKIESKQQQNKSV